jgi:uncharacterized membrane protein YidH (DUF202 family)
VFIIIFTIRVAWQKDSLALISHGFAFQGSLVGGGGGVRFNFQPWNVARYEYTAAFFSHV